MNTNNSDTVSREQLYKAMFEHATVGIVMTNQKGIILEINSCANEIFGYEKNELLGQPVEKLIPAPNHEKHILYRKQYFDSPSRRLMGVGRELFGVRKDGQQFPVEVSLSHAVMDDQKVAIAFINDITKRREMVNYLQESEARITAIINSAADGIITIDQKGIIQTMNLAAAKLFGYQPEETIGKNVKILMPEPNHSNHDGYLNNYHQTKERKIIGIGREVMGKKKDGTTFPLHLSISEAIIKQEKVYTGILHDLTSRRAAEEKIRRHTLALERSNRELQDFAYVSSHDLQEPLRKIRAFGDRLKIKDGDKLGEKGHDYLNRMLNAAERMQRLITDLLQFSRVNTNAKPFEEIALNEILEEVISDLEIAIEKSSAQIEVGILSKIEAEPFQMRQLFQNLISNAIKFRKREVNPVIRVFEDKKQGNDEEIIIYVEDNGIGFDERYAEKIFQIFQRLEGRKYEGSGIGLAICQRIANRHGGSIHAHGQIGKGATFTIKLSTKQNPVE